MNFSKQCVFYSLIPTAVAFLVLFSKLKVTFVKSSWFRPPEWLIDFSINMCGYSTIIIPGAAIVYLVKKYDVTNQMDDSIIKCLLNRFVYGSSTFLPYVDASDKVNSSPADQSAGKTELKKLPALIFCSSGLIFSYLLWGIAQERLVSYPYQNEDAIEEGAERFKDSLFLELSNRMLSFLAALFVLLVTYQPSHKAPLYEYSYNSFTCLMSSWCQYEALKYVSFPLQVLVKASKIIPVMLMGRLVSKKSYSNFEYFTAVLMSLGLFMFMTNEQDSQTHTITTSSNLDYNNSHSVEENGSIVKRHSFFNLSVVSGSILMVGYMGFDSFTSNWQSEMFKRYEPSHIHMMVGTNFFEILFASVTLLGRKGFQNAYNFSMRHPSFKVHLLGLALTSALGQFFIFYTIKLFGPVTFVIIMTVRQALSVAISCLVYGHTVHYLGIFGVLLFFFAIVLRMLR